MFDTHAHLDFKEFDKDREQVIERAFSNGVKKIINVGCNLKTSKNSVELSNRYENIFAAIGIHPEEINEEKIEINKKINELRKMAKNKKVVAIGEIGLDYQENKKQKTKNKKIQSEIQNSQKNILIQQIELAQELNLAIIFHCRKAHNDLLEIFRKLQIASCELRGVIHCFTGNYQQAKEYLKMGFYLGFGGIIFKMNLNEIIKKIPLDRILIETDCPFLTPPLSVASGIPECRLHVLIKADAQSKKINRNRNEPIFVKYAAKKIAEIKKMSFQKIEKATTQNAEKLFGV
jgi:TatD DNase family protein